MNHFPRNQSTFSDLMEQNKPRLLSGFFDNVGDWASGIGGAWAGFLQSIPESGNAIVTGTGQGVGGYVSNPNNIAQIANVAGMATLGFNPGLVNQPMPGQANPYQLSTLLNNPMVLIAGLGLVYLITRK
jgi:hypothetical protein